jgi:hypothetical protein
MRRPLAVSVAIGLALGLAPGAFASSGRHHRLPANPGLFLNVLPAGQGTTTTAADALQYEATGAADDAISYKAVGLVSVPDSPWQNRPTFQQVVEVTSHRPR